MLHNTKDALKKQHSEEEKLQMLKLQEDKLINNYKFVELKSQSQELHLDNHKKNKKHHNNN